jgi:hypothetical protein
MNKWKKNYLLPAATEDQFNIKPIYKSFPVGKQILKELEI